jgi:chemotaxis protein MotB
MSESFTPTISRKKKAKHKASHERWVVSYADLLTLLLAFFVVLYAASHHDQHKLDQAANGFIQAFHGTPVPVVEAPSADRGVMQNQPSPIKKPIPSPASADSRVPRQMIHQLSEEMLSLAKVRQQLLKVLQPMMASNQVAVQSQPLTLTIQLNASVLFGSGQAQLMPAAAKLLKQVGSSLTGLPPQFMVVVQGYTDNQPIKSAAFSSNWSLSAERSVSVVELFQNVGVSGGQLAAQGFGEFAPVASNATDSGRAQNRRVVIVIHAPDPGNK